jgi:hypothetical protein
MLQTFWRPLMHQHLWLMLQALFAWLRWAQVLFVQRRQVQVQCWNQTA